ncbi:unnamed protein product [Penicillium olsonii]|uniref:CN hydrolase domain-containing protein n=1 Tax=Penicillium olsonii TaxID=99116 RepID=A0A9W4N2T9_PENOL|nr:unnamed protein product [Penicillium olsonii]CAG8081973.1 unnamed protein product [Penicillium olsonii]CAG8236273.1 unnamed protein product [Penicillium olsonii]
MVLAAVGQICSTASISSNLAQCRLLVQKAAVAGAKVLFLPEASDYIASSAEQSYSLAQSAERDSFVSALQQDAAQHSIHINVGIHEVASESRLKNLLIWIDNQGAITQSYQKVHLFDVDIKDGPCLKESALALRRQNAEIITYPSAFTVPTGKAHWEPLLRARAIETQSYVIAAAQAGPHNEKRRSYGHSVIISPWGEVVASLGDEYQEPQIATVDIDLDLVAKIRREMPLLRRNDLYPEL